MSAPASTTSTPAALCRGLSFGYTDGTSGPLIRNLDLVIPRGARLLLTGANGAGKTTLLRLLAGKHLVRSSIYVARAPGNPNMPVDELSTATSTGAISSSGNGVLDLVEAFEATPAEGVRYLGGQWAQRLEGGRYGTPFEADVLVRGLLVSEVGETLCNAAVSCALGHTRAAAAGTLLEPGAPELAGYTDALSVADAELAQRLGFLLFTLDIDIRWRMHRVSDGQRRRIQILLSVMRPFSLILLDEITVDLDVLVRHDFLQWLKRECDTRGATVVYATHIFDGLGGWVTDIAHVSDGRVTRAGPVGSFTTPAAGVTPNNVEANSGLLTLVESWLREDQQEQAARDAKTVAAPKARDGVAAAPDAIITMPAAHGGSRFYNYWG